MRTTSNGTAEAELGIVNASGGTPALVVDNPTQTSGGRPRPRVQLDADLHHRRRPARLHHRGRPERQRTCSTWSSPTAQGNTISVILNPTSASPHGQTYNVAANAHRASRSADFNGDGILDLAVSTSNGVTILDGQRPRWLHLEGSYAAGTTPVGHRRGRLQRQRHAWTWRSPTAAPTTSRSCTATATGPSDRRQHRRRFRPGRYQGGRPGRQRPSWTWSWPTTARRQHGERPDQ